MTAMQLLAQHRTQEQWARQHREFKEAAEPIVKQIVAIHALALPKYIVKFGEHGEILEFDRTDDGIPDELKPALKRLTEEYERMARNYGFDLIDTTKPLAPHGK